MRRFQTQWTWFVIVGLLYAMGTECVRGQELEWRGFEEAVAVADSTNRFVMVAVYAPWCGWCRKMKRDVYPSSGVRECLAGDFVAARLNRADTDTKYRHNGRRATPREWESTFRIEEVPGTVILSPEGEYLLHLSGSVTSESLRSILSYFSTGSYQTTSFQAFRPNLQTVMDAPARAWGDQRRWTSRTQIVARRSNRIRGLETRPIRLTP